MTTAEMLPISEGRAKQLFDFLATPRTAEQVAEVAFASWFKADRESGLGRANDLLDQFCEQGRARKTADGKFEAVPENGELRDEAGEEIIDDDGAQPTGGAAESDSTEQPTVAKRGRKPGTKNKPKEESNGAGKPEVAHAAPPASKPKAQGRLTAAEEMTDHMNAIESVEGELAEAKIDYEDCLNVRRVKAAALAVAKNERRRFSVHEGSSLDEIMAAQKKVAKADKEYNASQSAALKAKNNVASVDAKLGRTIEGEMPLFEEKPEK